MQNSNKHVSYKDIQEKQMTPSFQKKWLCKKTEIVGPITKWPKKFFFLLNCFVSTLSTLNVLKLLF